MPMETGLPQIKDRLQVMAALAEDMVDRSVKALLEGDGARAHQVCIDDDQLDRMEEEIDELAMKILAGGPELSDLRAITISMKISNDLERIGDEASTIAKSVIQLKGAVLRATTSSTSLRYTSITCLPSIASIRAFLQISSTSLMACSKGALSL